MKIYSSINEFLANSPKPGVRPDIKPGISPGTKPKYPSPIRRDKPSVKPDPKAELEVLMVRATEEDLVERFISELRDQDREIEIDFSSMKKRYSK
jgi:hypothetical protein